jgi:hypothetical protein
MVEMAAVIGTGVQDVLALAELTSHLVKDSKITKGIMSRDTGHPY